MHPNIDVRWEAGVGTWRPNCAQVRAVLISTTHYNCCLPSSPWVPDQLQTCFAWSLALLNVLWQHLVERRKNCTEPWLLHLHPAIPVSAEDFQRHRFAAGELGIRGLASGLASTLCWAHLCRFPFSLHQTESQSRCTAGRFLSLRSSIPTTALLEIFL